MANCRTEKSAVYPMADGRKVTVTLRTTIVPEDPYMVLAYAKSLSVRTGEPISVSVTSRAVKDHLIKTNISI
jgi:hypothetical protein